MNKGLCIILLGLIFVSSGRQDRFKQNIFRSPIDFPLSLSGSFGDYRTNHFHSGIDIRTQGVTGKKVYATADGWVSRIRISPYGYGLAIYIDHPQGYTSLYGHLKSFEPGIAEYIKNKQYELRENEIDYYLEKDELKVSQGDVIALSGNSGSSSGPHIHFEIRDTRNQHPLNPLYFGFDVPDNLPPEVYNVRLYPIDPWSRINGKSMAQDFYLVKSGTSYRIKDAIEVSGKIGIGIYSLDRFTNGKYKHCFNALSMKVNEEETFSFRYEELDFETLRDVNSHMDYEMKLDKKQKVTKCYKEPFSRLDFYDKIVNNGIIELKEKERANVQITLTDNFDNKSEITFSLTGQNNDIRKGANISFVKKLEAQKENVYRDSDVALFFPVDRLYKDVYLNLIKEDVHENISAIIEVLPKATALKDWYTLKMACDTAKYRHADKLAIGSIRGENDVRLYPTSFKNGWAQAQVKEFGAFKVVEDLEPPSVNFIHLNKKTANLTLEVLDNFEQISEYEATIDGRWLRIYYDRKNDLFKSNLSELTLSPGEHELEVRVSDEQKNLGMLKMKIQL